MSFETKLEKLKEECGKTEDEIRIQKERLKAFNEARMDLVVSEIGNLKNMLHGLHDFIPDGDGQFNNLIPRNTKNLRSTKNVDPAPDTNKEEANRSQQENDVDERLDQRKKSNAMPEKTAPFDIGEEGTKHQLGKKLTAKSKPKRTFDDFAQDGLESHETGETQITAKIHPRGSTGVPRKASHTPATAKRVRQNSTHDDSTKRKHQLEQNELDTKTDDEAQLLEKIAGK
jgi:hypothetical protein